MSEEGMRTQITARKNDTIETADGIGELHASAPTLMNKNIIIAETGIESPSPKIPIEGSSEEKDDRFSQSSLRFAAVSLRTEINSGLKPNSNLIGPPPKRGPNMLNKPKHVK